MARQWGKMVRDYSRVDERDKGKEMRESWKYPLECRLFCCHEIALSSPSRVIVKYFFVSWWWGGETMQSCWNHAFFLKEQKENLRHTCVKITHMMIIFLGLSRDKQTQKDNLKIVRSITHLIWRSVTTINKNNNSSQTLLLLRMIVSRLYLHYLQQLSHSPCLLMVVSERNESHTWVKWALDWLLQAHLQL